MGWRQLWRNPGFAVAALLTLAAAVGLNTALFSVVYAVLLRPLPLASPERIVVLQRRPAGEQPYIGLSEPAYVELTHSAHGLEGVAALDFRSLTVRTGAGPERVMALLGTPSVFGVAGVAARLGRGFDVGAGQPGGDGVVVLSDSYWRSRFGGDAHVVGRTMQVDERTCVIVGVLPAGLTFVGPAADLWLPLVVDAARFGPGSAENNNRIVIARLARGTLLASAQAESGSWVQAVRAVYPNAFSDGTQLGVLPLREVIAGRYRALLLLLLGAVGLVLLIGCANLANLMLVRGAARVQELAVRSALGASLKRLIGQLLLESLVLGVVGGTAGLVPAWLALGLVRRLTPVSLPGLESAGLQAPVLAFAGAIAVTAGLLFGLAPVLQVARARLAGSLRAGGRGAVRGTRGHELLVAAEVALAAVLLVGAMLLVRSMVRLFAVDAGFDWQDRVTAQVTLPGDRYATDAAVHALLQPLLASVRSLPGVRSAALVQTLPLTGASNWGYEVEGHAGEKIRFADYNLVSPGYFQTLGIPLRRGRDFEIADETDGRNVVIISESMARRVFGNVDPVGQRINMNIRGQVWREIVGVAGDVRSRSLSVSSPDEVYLPPRRLPFTAPLENGDRHARRACRR